LHIAQQFEDLIGLPNICGAIDGTHIPLAKRPNKKVYYCNCGLLQLKKVS
jgi:hypothetical protein